MKQLNMKASQIVAALEEDLNDRSGLHINDLDKATQAELRREWKKIVEKILEEE